LEGGGLADGLGEGGEVDDVGRGAGVDDDEMLEVVEGDLGFQGGEVVGGFGGPDELREVGGRCFDVGGWRPVTSGCSLTRMASAAQAFPGRAAFGAAAGGLAEGAEPPDEPGC
jgi:hypothetical protein